MDNTLCYYVEQLGFQVEFRYAEDPDNYSGVVRDNVYLHLQWQDEQLFKDGRAGNLKVRINVADPDTIFSEYKAKGFLDEKV